MSVTPPEFAASPLAGMDFSWLAVDDDGHVAWLVTFGSAVVPQWVEGRSEDFGGIEDALAALPELGGCVAQETGHHLEEWRSAARKGVFAYDWDVYRGPYRVVAAPVIPLKAEALPPSLSALARRTRFTGVCFCDRKALALPDVLACSQDASEPAP